MKSDVTTGSGIQMLVLRGAAAILFGIIVFALPQATLQVPALMIAIYAFIDGALEIGCTFSSKTWGRAVPGLLGFAVAVFCLFDQEMAGSGIVWLAAFWMIARGAFDMDRAAKRRGASTGERIGYLGGILSVAVGVGIAVLPDPRAAVIARILGAYAAVYGTIVIADTMNLGRIRNDVAGQERRVQKS